MVGIRTHKQHTFSSANALPLPTVVVIPTYHASVYWKQLHEALRRERIPPDQVLIIDSSSTDNTQDLVRRAGYNLKVIDRCDFGHGATRQMAAEMVPHAEVLVYLTQDAIPTGNNSIRRLVDAFRDPSVGAAYGRQLPRPQANAIERHARMFNYPSTSEVRDFESRHILGIKAAFFSNSFAAYRRTAFDEVGGFPQQSIVSEEVSVAARMLMAGWRVAYEAEANVIHSHPFTVRQEFARYFDIGVAHNQEEWLLDTFGRAGGEGRRFVVSEAKFLLENKPGLLPLAVMRTFSKAFAYKLGRAEAILPEAVKRFLSAQPNYWRRDRPNTPPLMDHSESSFAAVSAALSERR